MKKDFSIVLRDIDGTVLKHSKKCDEDKTIKVDLTYAQRILDSLLGTHPTKDGSQSGEEKLKLYRLAVKIQDSTPETDYDLDELTLIKKRVEMFMPPLIYGQVVDMLDCKEE